jgi:tetratricopeptide (TPR) repeat protein
MRCLRSPALAACALATTLALFISTPIRADTVVLQNGTRLEGELERTEDGYNVTTPDGKTVKVASSQIKSVEIKPQTTPDDAKKRLESLRRSVENMSDLKLIIGRYNEYLRRFVGTDVADDALDDLKLWEDRLAKHMTKSGGKWVTPEELGVIQEEAQVAAQKARDLIAQGRLREAGPLLDLALRQDARSPPALYLRGVMLYRQEQLGQARKAFDTVSQLVPDHGPTLNNLAVILWRQEQHAGALKSYDAAMIASAADDRILSNVAEALHALPKELRDSAATKKVVVHFQEREDALRKKMEKRGLYRWGATWVRGEELDRLQDIEREIEGKIQDLEAEFDTAQGKIERIDQEIADTQRSIRRIEATSYSRDASGRMTKLAYPRIYYELLRDMEVLKRDRADQVALMDKLRREAKAEKQRLPVPRYTGIQRIIETEGTPLIPLAREAVDQLGAAEEADAPRKRGG